MPVNTALKGLVRLTDAPVGHKYSGMVIYMPY